MASDPYGFAESPGASANGSASQALYAGVFSLVCAAVGPCFCYGPYLLALPAGAYALYSAVRVPAGTDELGAAEKSMANAGMLAGGVAVALSLLLVAVFFLYTVLVIIGAVAGGTD
jgi:hypothetical protein